MRWCLILALTGWISAAPIFLVAQDAPTDRDLRRLHTELREHATGLLLRFGDTFYALGGLLTVDGDYEEFATDSWPSLDAPPAEWQDSLVASFRRSNRPVRAVAILIDLGRAGGPEPVTTAGYFHGETRTTCAEIEVPYTVLQDGSIRWEKRMTRSCRRLLLPITAP